MNKELPIVNMEQRIGRVQAMLPLKDKTDSLNKSGSSEDLMEVDEKENAENSTMDGVSKGNEENLIERRKKKNRKNVVGHKEEDSSSDLSSENAGINQKRKMYFAAETSKIFGPDGDNLFTKRKREIKRLVKRMNHATRFYLAVKFYRRNSADFETNAKIESKFSKKKCCELLGIVYNSLKDICRKQMKDKNLEEFMKSKRYLSPVEFNPQFSRAFFKKYATNYDQLNVGGIFKMKQKELMTTLE